MSSKRRELLIYAIIILGIIGILVGFLGVHLEISGFFPRYPCAECHG